MNDMCKYCRHGPCRRFCEALIPYYDGKWNRQDYERMTPALRERHDKLIEGNVKAFKTRMKEVTI